MGVEGTHVRIAERGSRSTAWTAVTFTNSWVDFGGGRQAVQYRKVGDNVEVRGTMKNGTISASAFTLPAGFRPPANCNPTTAGFNGVAIVAYWTVSTAGACAPTASSNAEVSCNFSFSTTV